MDRMCDYDEGYERRDAYDIGWCYDCKCNSECPYKKKTIEDMFKVMGNPLKLKGKLR